MLFLAFFVWKTASMPEKVARIRKTTYGQMPWAQRRNCQQQCQNFYRQLGPNFKHFKKSYRTYFWILFWKNTQSFRKQKQNSRKMDFKLNLEILVALWPKPRPDCAQNAKNRKIQARKRPRAFVPPVFLFFLRPELQTRRCQLDSTDHPSGRTRSSRAVWTRRVGQDFNCTASVTDLEISHKMA